jgi:hypothetical protein
LIALIKSVSWAEAVIGDKPTAAIEDQSKMRQGFMRDLPCKARANALRRKPS